MQAQAALGASGEQLQQVGSRPPCTRELCRPPSAAACRRRRHVPPPSLRLDREACPVMQQVPTAAMADAKLADKRKLTWAQISKSLCAGGIAGAV